MPAAERERLIVTEAIRFFADEGFDGQIRTLAARIGITHSTLFRHFPSKDALIERVYQEVFVKRVRPEWSTLLQDRSRPLATRLLAFYRDYTDAIFHHDWIRIFMFAGLRGVPINATYLKLLRDSVLVPICRELRLEANRSDPSEAPISDAEIERAWGLHGRIFYLAIRKFVYGMTIPSRLDQTFEDAIEAFLQADPLNENLAVIPTLDDSVRSSSLRGPLSDAIQGQHESLGPAPAAPHPQRRLPPQDRERLIVAGATTFFAEHGMNGQMRELARKLGITHPLLYRYFPTKEALIGRVYEEVYVNRWSASWEALLQDSSRPLSDRLTAFYIQYSDAIDRYEWIRIFVFAGLHGVWICKRYLDLVEQRVIETVADAVCRERPGAGAISQRDREIAWGLHGQIVYLSIRRWIYGVPAIGPPDKIVQAAVAAVLAAAR